MCVCWRNRRKKKQLYPGTLKQSTFLSLFCCESNGRYQFLCCCCVVGVWLHIITRQAKNTTKYHLPNKRIFSPYSDSSNDTQSSQDKRFFFFVALLFYLCVCLRLPRFRLQKFQKRFKTNGKTEHCFKIAAL